MPGYGHSGYGSASYTNAGTGVRGPSMNAQPTDYLKALMRQGGRRTTATERPRGGGANAAYRNMREREALTGGQPVGFGGHGISAAEKALPAVAARHEIKRMRTLEQGPPVEHRYSGGHYLGLQPKTETMTGLQRQTFLPGGSDQIPDAPMRGIAPVIAGVQRTQPSGTRADFFGTGSNIPGIQDEIIAGRDAANDVDFLRFLQSLYGGR